MSGQWTGDVARVTLLGEPSMLSIRVTGCQTAGHPRADHWHTERGTYGEHPDMVRRLVVIDPEDREQVERLAKAWHVQPGVLPWDECDKRDKADSVNSLQAALREFANPKPPKPEEPTGLGAVVRDSKGDIWIHVELAEDAGCWVRNGDELADEWTEWDRLHAVDVLSEGATL